MSSIDTWDIFLEKFIPLLLLKKEVEAQKTEEVKAMMEERSNLKINTSILLLNSESAL